MRLEEVQLSKVSSNRLSKDSNRHHNKLEEQSEGPTERPLIVLDFKDLGYQTQESARKMAKEESMENRMAQSYGVV
jgi:hypothetical protein